MALRNLSTAEREFFLRIKSLLCEADQACSNWDYVRGAPDDDEKERVETLVERAYEQALFLMENLSLPDARSRIQKSYDSAKGRFADTKYSSNMGEFYLVWSNQLSQHLSPVDLPAITLTPERTDINVVIQMCDKFHAVALRLRNRRAEKPALCIDDEYDVQYLFGALLLTRFSDVRAEEATSSHGAKGARMDFLLKNESIAIEMKMMRDSMNQKQAADQIIVDKARYRNHPGCNALVCFVYDPDAKIANPPGFEKDLSEDDGDFIVRVLVRPSL